MNDRPIEILRQKTQQESQAESRAETLQNNHDTLRFIPHDVGYKQVCPQYYNLKAFWKYDTKKMH